MPNVPHPGKDAERGPIGEDAHQKVMTIGEVCDMFGLTHRSLRFYEEKGLLKPNTAGKHRRYTHQDIEVIKIIVYGKHLGFPLKKIKEIVQQNEKPVVNDLSMSIVNCEKRIVDLERQKVDIDLALTEMRRTLEHLRSLQIAQVVNKT